MAASGKKGKKPKGKTFALTEFLADGATGAPSPVIRNKAWADEVDNDDDVFDPAGGRNKQPVVLPTAPRATRNLNVDDENIPKHPPFNAYISNLQYDVAEDEIEEFFKDMKIVNVRLPRDDRGGGRLKGFGYVEFDSRESLIAALNIGDTTIKGRRMRIEVASATEGERRGGRSGGRDMGYDQRDRGDGPDRTLGDWRSGPREDPPGDKGGATNRDNGDGRPSDRGPFTRENMDRGAFTRDNMGSSFNRESTDRGAFTRDNMGSSFNRESTDRGAFTRDNMGSSFNRESTDRGAFTRDNMGSSFNRENTDRGSFTRDNMDRSFNRESTDRGSDRGPFTRDNMDRSFAREGGDRGDRGSFNRDNADRGAFTRDNMDGGFNNRRDGGADRSSRGPGFRSGYDRETSGAGGERYPEREPRRNDEPEADREVNGTSQPVVEGGGGGGGGEVKERPRLKLAPRRTLPDADAPAAAASQAAIFGGAKPVDTAARERQIEERLAKQKEPPTPRVESSAGEQTAPSAGAPVSAPSATGGPTGPSNHTAGPRRPYNAGAGVGAGPGRGGPPRADPPAPRMPKLLLDQAAPNFAVANKFGLLPTEGDVDANDHSD